MVTGTMAITTGTTKTITRISRTRFGMAAFAGMLALFACANIFSFPTSAAALNSRILKAFEEPGASPLKVRPEALTELRVSQEEALAHEPADPYAWARLSYLRMATGQDAKTAFDALRLSDLVSPNDPRQLPERAFMWRDLRAVQTPEQQNYQALLWQKAWLAQRKETYARAEEKKISAEVGESLKKTNPALYEEWKNFK